MDFISKYAHEIVLLIAFHQRGILAYSSITYRDPNDKNMYCPSI